ncbi:serine/threonine protein kinase [Actinomadura sp. LD22]|uniref:Serine/threonine protein kinase n=1 Tax=Actinomadura physcomitrii TaxID=2650748 RepID=A0A6I4MNK0_9ACTN|nr:serine/threonine protein kinase [Actinomadura physcomitrii]
MVASSPANAATSPAAACGSGYYQIDHHNLSTAVIYLMYNGSTNCVVTWKTAYLSSATDTYAVIEKETAGGGIDIDSDQGLYHTYAGPVYAYAPGACIKWGGDAKGSTQWMSGWQHCG